jgi:hypothetical protein
MRRIRVLTVLLVLCVAASPTWALYIEGTVTAVRQTSFEVRLEDGKVRSFEVSKEILTGKIPASEIRFRNHLKELTVGYKVYFHSDEAGHRPAKCNELQITDPPQPKYKLPTAPVARSRPFTRKDLEAWEKMNPPKAPQVEDPRFKGIPPSPGDRQPMPRGK